MISFQSTKVGVFELSQFAADEKESCQQYHCHRSQEVDMDVWPGPESEEDHDGELSAPVLSRVTPSIGDWFLETIGRLSAMQIT